MRSLRSQLAFLRPNTMTSVMAGAIAALAMACSGGGGGTEVAKPPPQPDADKQEAPKSSGSAMPQPTAAANAPNAPNAPPTAAPTSSAAAPPPPAPACAAGMTLVAGGTFKMDLRKDPVTVGALCVDTTEVTASSYAACVKAGQCSADNLKCAPQATYEAEGKGDHPVVCVDFTQATSYCKAQSKRLPSDEEWEWAARGGAEGRMYPWGNKTPKDQVCWSGVQTRNGTCPVGSLAAGDNPQGIHDLAGNVFEWTTTRNDAKTKVRVGRGGSWKDGLPEFMRASRPGGFEVTYRCGFLGIRCVTEAPPGAVDTAGASSAAAPK